MAVYYEDDSVQVTSTMLRIDAAAYPIAELRYVWHHRSRATVRGASRALARWLIVTALTIPLVLLALCLIGLPFMRVDGELRTGALVLGIAASIVVAILLAPLLEIPLTTLDRIHDRGTAAHELWAYCAGHEIMLLETTDALRFGQIYRALQRAIENGA